MLELPIAPARGQHVRLAAGEEAHPIDRVIVTARAAVDFTPGWKAASLLDVLLAPEPQLDLPPLSLPAGKAV